MFYKATLSSLSMLQYFYSAAQGPGGVSSIWGLQNMVPISLTRKNIAHSCVQNPDFQPTSAPQHPITACTEESKRSPEETNKGPPITRPLVFYVNNNVWQMSDFLSPPSHATAGQTRQTLRPLFPNGKPNFAVLYDHGPTVGSPPPTPPSLQSS